MNYSLPLHRMRMVVGLGAVRRVAGRCHYSILTSHLRHQSSTHLSLTPLPLHHDPRHRLLCTARLLLSTQAASRWLLPREPVRCFHTDRGKCDQVTSRTEGQGTTATTTTSYVSCVVREVVDHWTQKLATEEVPEGHLAAQHIMAHVLGVRRSELQRPAIAETELSEEQMEEVDRLMTCRIARMPLQYILGEWDFHSLTLKMAPPVFIPRPETEGLVELAIDVLREMESPRVLEIGCGSGAISLALLNALPQVECVAVDQSRHAVRLTESNAVQLGLKGRLTVVLGKVNKDTRPPLPHSSYDLVVSNPPYIFRKDLLDLQPEIMMYEDLRALDGGKDGLEMIKALVLHAQHLLLPGRTLLMEVDPCHPYLLPAWLEKQNLHLKLLKVHQDFNNKDRIMEFIKEI